MISSHPTGDDGPLRITEIAEKLELNLEDVEPVGWYKAKFSPGIENRLPARSGSRYVGVSAVSPTPLGEGKTVTAVGLAMGLNRLGRSAIVTLRQPSQAPVFGIKGGGAGGGRARLLPAEEINLHFTGDLHAVAAANNLLAALIDNHMKRRLAPLLDPSTVTWRRVIDVSDRGLAHIVTGLGESLQGPLRETGFDLSAASEVMAILALSLSFQDLRGRLGRILVGLTPTGEPIHVERLGWAGAMAALLRDAIRPNLVQTCEHTPALVHAGPFGNIAHGNSSILADRIALRLADFVITESGFGADLGAEKFFHLKCRTSGMRPNAEVLVCTARALKFQSGRFSVRAGKPLPTALLSEDVEALRAGACNLEAHLDILRQFGLPVVVAVNRFPGDSPRELDLIRSIARDNGVRVAFSDAFARGGEGTEDLAQEVQAACNEPSELQFLYPPDISAEEKLEILVTRVYGASGVVFDPLARRRLALYRELGYGKLPICVAKTQYSLSHDPKLLGRPRDYPFPIRDVRLAAGAGYLYALAGEIQTMPGLPSEPAAMRIDVDSDGNIRGLNGHRDEDG